MCRGHIAALDGKSIHAVYQTVLFFMYCEHLSDRQELSTSGSYHRLHCPVKFWEFPTKTKKTHLQSTVLKRLVITSVRSLHVSGGGVSTIPSCQASVGASKARKSLNGQGSPTLIQSFLPVFPEKTNIFLGWTQKLGDMTNMVIIIGIRYVHIFFGMCSKFQG